MNPFVTLILPIRNEAKSITETLQAVLAQDYPPESMEVLIADGQSTDGTRERIAQLLQRARRIPVRLLDNPGKIVPTGLNIALREARGEVIVRVDGRTIIAPDYVRQCVTALQASGADNVGGRMNAAGMNRFACGVALATSSPFGVGGGRFHYSDDEEWVDTVYMGAWPRRVFREVGLFDEELVRDQDDEFNYRLRAAGGKILLKPQVKSKYAVRSYPLALWWQYFQYGYWKIRVLQKHPRQMSARQFVPPTLVLGLIASVLLAVVPFVGPLSWMLRPLAPSFGLAALAMPLMYLLANLSASALTSAKKGWKYLPLLPVTFAILHVSYGLGFLVGLLRFAGRWGDRVGRVPDWSAGRTARVEPLAPAYMPSLDQFVSRNVKRAFDIVSSAVGMLVLFPFYAMVVMRIRGERSGPVFYRGARIGKNGKPFNILKFRTMYDNAESFDGPSVTSTDDARVTPLGRWLRETKLNELPQLLNVLKGEMSMVGPRPEVAEFVQTWPSEARREILSIAPGITSPASVTYRDEEKLLKSANVMDVYLKALVPNKLRLDQLYVRNHNFLGDLDVIFMTLAALLPQMRESKIKPEILYNGGLSRFVRRHVSWFFIDSMVALVAVALSGLLWRLEQPLELGLTQAVGMAALMALIFGLVNSARGLGKVVWRAARAAYALDVFLSSAITTVGLATLDWFWPHHHFLPTGMVVVAGMLACSGFLAVRYKERLLTGVAWRWLSHREHETTMREHVLIVGAGDCGLLACWLLKHSQLSHLFSITGMVDDNPIKDGMVIDGHQVFGLTRRIPELVQQKDIGVILFAIEKINPEEQKRIMELCWQTRARLVMVPDLMQMFTDRISRDDNTRPLVAGVAKPLPVLPPIDATGEI